MSMNLHDLYERGFIRNAAGGEAAEGGGLRPLRFTDRQMELYGRQENFAIRSRCPAGICLDLMTDTAFIDLEYRIEGAVRKWVYFDIYEDDVFKASLGVKDASEDTGHMQYTLSSPVSGEKAQGSRLRRLTVYFPHSVAMVLTAVNLSEGAVTAPADPPSRKLLCLGDSITQGMDARKPSAAYPVLLSRSLGMQLLNQGVGGYIFEAESLDPALPYFPDLITVAYGTNDWGRYSEIGLFRQKCADYLAKLVSIYPSVPIYLLTPFWRADQDQARPLGTMEQLSAVIGESGSVYPSVRVIDGQKLIPQLPQLFGDAYLHPNDEGFIHIALNLFRIIQADGQAG